MTIERSDEAFAAANWGSLVVLVWRDGVVLNHVQLAVSFQRELTRGGSKVSVIHVHAMTALDAVPDSVRQGIARMISELSPNVVAQAHLVLAQGFRAAIVRSAIASIMQASGRTAPTQTFSTLPEAVRWIAERAGQDAELSADIDALVVEVQTFIDTELARPHAAAPAAAAAKTARE